MIKITSQNNIYQLFEQYFKSNIINHISDEFYQIYFVDIAKIRDISTFLNEKYFTLINISILDYSKNFQLIYEFHSRLVKNSSFLFLILMIGNDDSINSIRHIYPQSRCYENEIEKRYGLCFNSNNDSGYSETLTIPHSLKSENKSKYFIPLGINNYNANIKNYINLFFNKNKITAIKEKTGWSYRGIIPLLQNKPFKENVELTKRISFLGSFHHNLAYIMALEKLCAIEVQSRVNQSRTIFCELERFENMLTWFINLFHLLNKEKISKKLMQNRLMFHQSLRKNLKIRFFDDINYIGYCHDFPNGDWLEFQNNLNDLAKNAINIIINSVYNTLLKKRCENIGILTSEDAINVGVTGPCIRASGIAHDIRLENPYLSYLNKDLIKRWNIVTSRNGDVHSRIETRAWEMRNAIKIINHLITHLIDDDEEIIVFDDKNLILPKNLISIMQVESPQGELTYYLKTSESGDPSILAGASICSPSLKNFLALNDYLLKNASKSNFKLIVHSMDLNFNEIDL